MASSVVFSDPESAQRARTRLEALTGWGLEGFFETTFEDCPAPDVSLINLERWLRASTNPATQMSLLMQAPRLSRLVALILGASQPLADALIQNPEMAGLITDPGVLSRIPERAGILDEGRRLLAATSGYTHALDRLRFLQQTWTLRIVVNDLARVWPPETVWRAVSDLADALIELTLEVSWSEFSAQKGLHSACPVMVVGFGKLGGRELNYSSDVDLVYVIPDEVDDVLEQQSGRFSEVLGRALSDRMGRGDLYRVDLRLRPFGSAGPVVQRMRAVEAYYRSHAEAWEAQALIRSRPIVGPAALASRWAAMRESVCFRPKLSTATLEAMVAMRERVEAHADADDLKRGHGGIRDVEFLTQALQMVHGHAMADVQSPATLDAVAALLSHGILSEEDAEGLASGYRFLRQLEHRCQLVDGKQTHRLPTGERERERIARLMGYERSSDLDLELDACRSRLRELYRRLVMPPAEAVSYRDQALNALGVLAPLAAEWFDAMPESEAFFQTLVDNEGSLERVRRVLVGAPDLIRHLKTAVSHTEALISGEIEESAGIGRIELLSTDSPLDRVASAIRSEWLSAALRWVIDDSYDVHGALSALAESSLRHIARRLYAEFEIVGLGSFGAQETTFSSDADLLLLAPEASRHPEAEQEAQQFLSVVQHLRRHGAPIEVDLRLRPEGGQGLLVRTYAGFEAYDLEAMEMWERMALIQARSIYGSQEAERRVRKAALALPLTPERLEQLLEMKRRIETERVRPQHRRRHVKLGLGGLSDIEWYLGLHEMRFPTATEAGTPRRTPERLRALARAGLIHAIEFEELLAGWKILGDTRDRLFLLGFTQDIVPENPDKLDRLAFATGMASGNDFLMRHERTIDTVRAIYTEGVDRLKA
jgi:[glutamine synthetase] adenylyltransferase / [glutamine synthetase]-adenylyl-L-tyrosine phosphorylase